MSKISLRLLGQSGCYIKVYGKVIYFDPYLSNSVEELDAPDFKRLVSIPVSPEEVTNADWVLITHEHIDHCDPHTLPIIAEASHHCRFMGPPRVIARLASWGISRSRCHIALDDWASLGNEIRVIAVPAAHPKICRDSVGHPHCVGYVMEVDNKRLYFAGDTSVTDELIAVLSELTPISTALLPVNEHNYFLGRRGIIGNMSIRDAFLLAEELKIGRVIPVHWDMFAINSVSHEEINAVYRQLTPSFELDMHPGLIEL